MHLIINSQKQIIRKEKRVKKISNDNLNILNKFTVKIINALTEHWK